MDLKLDINDEDIAILNSPKFNELKTRKGHNLNVDDLAELRKYVLYTSYIQKELANRSGNFFASLRAYGERNGVLSKRQFSYTGLLYDPIGRNRRDNSTTNEVQNELTERDNIERTEVDTELTERDMKVLNSKKFEYLKKEYLEKIGNLPLRDIESLRRHVPYTLQLDLTLLSQRNEFYRSTLREYGNKNGVLSHKQIHNLAGSYRPSEEEVTKIQELDDDDIMKKHYNTYGLLNQDFREQLSEMDVAAVVDRSDYKFVASMTTNHEYVQEIRRIVEAPRMSVRQFKRLQAMVRVTGDYVPSEIEIHKIELLDRHSTLRTHYDKYRVLTLDLHNYLVSLSSPGDFLLHEEKKLIFNMPSTHYMAIKIKRLASEALLSSEDKVELYDLLKRVGDNVLTEEDEGNIELLPARHNIRKHYSKFHVLTSELYHEYKQLLDQQVENSFEIKGNLFDETFLNWMIKCSFGDYDVFRLEKGPDHIKVRWIPKFDGRMKGAQLVGTIGLDTKTLTPLFALDSYATGKLVVLMNLLNDAFEGMFLFRTRFGRCVKCNRVLKRVGPWQLTGDTCLRNIVLRTGAQRLTI